MKSVAMRLLARERGLFVGALIVAGIAASLGVPVDFLLFALTLAGVALFHHHTLQVALIGLAAITLYKLGFTGFRTGTGLPGLGGHLLHEWVILTNLLGLLLGLLDAALEIADRVQVLGYLGLVLRADAALETGHVPGDPVEDAAVARHPGHPRFRVGAVGIAEQPLEEIGRAHV